MTEQQGRTSLLWKRLRTNYPKKSVSSVLKNRIGIAQICSSNCQDVTFWNKTFRTVLLCNLFPSNRCKWFIETVVLESFPKLSTSFEFSWCLKIKKRAWTGNRKTRRGFSESDFCDFNLKAFLSGSQLFANGKGVNYTKMQNIRLNKKLPLTSQFTPTPRNQEKFGVIYVPLRPLSPNQNYECSQIRRANSIILYSYNSSIY